MKTGEAFWYSEEQRAFDLAITAPCMPILWAARTALHATVNDGGADIFTQMRVGSGEDSDRLFEIEKLRTLGADKKPLNKLAGLYRKWGVDELAQLANIRRGQMAVCGYRPLVLHGEEPVAGFEDVKATLPPRLRGRWEDITSHSKPGILSSYGLYHHTHPEHDPNEYEIRAEMDIRDAMEASVYSNLRLLGRFISIAVRRRLQ